MKKIILLNLVIIFFFIFFLEILANFFNLSQLLGMESKLIGKKNNSHYLIPGSTGKIFGKKVYIDNNGFRVPNLNYKYTGGKNVYIIGDSVAFGNGVKEGNTFIGLLRKNFTKINFYNSSVPGYQIKNHTDNLEKIKNFKQIKQLIYFYTLNDIYDSTNIQERIDQEYRNSPKFFNKRIFGKINSYLISKSYLYLYIKGIASDPSKRWFVALNNFYTKKDISFVKEEFKKLKNFSIAHKSNLTIIILPYEYQTRDCENEKFLPQKKIIDSLKDVEIKFIDYTKYFCDNKNNENFLKFDPMHLSNAGHNMVYNLLLDEKIF